MAASRHLITDINHRLSSLGKFLTRDGVPDTVIANNNVEYYQFKLKKITSAENIVGVFRGNEDVHMRQLFICPENVAELTYWHTHRIELGDTTITRDAKNYRAIVWFPKSEINRRNITCDVVGGGLGLFANTDIYRGQFLRIPVIPSETAKPPSYDAIDINDYQFHNSADAASPIHPDKHFETWRLSVLFCAPMTLDGVAPSSVYQVKYLFNSSHLERPPTGANMTTNVWDTGARMDFICARHCVEGTQLFIDYSWDSVPIRP